MKTGKAVIFDMDGVIFDSERIVQESWSIVAERHNIPDVIDACRHCLGLCQADTYTYFLSRYGEDFLYWEYKEEMRDVYWNVLYGEHLPLKPGIVELLTDLKAAGIPTAVASSTSEKTVRRELTDAGIIDYFDRLVCGDMVKKSKPNPEIYRTACEVLGIEPRDAWAIEDSFNGLRSAHAAGMMTIMVPDQVQPTKEILDQITVVCDSLLAVKDMLFPDKKGQ